MLLPDLCESRALRLHVRIVCHVSWEIVFWYAYTRTSHTCVLVCVGEYRIAVCCFSICMYCIIVFSMGETAPRHGTQLRWCASDISCRHVPQCMYACMVSYTNETFYCWYIHDKHAERQPCNKPPCCNSHISICTRVANYTCCMIIHWISAEAWAWCWGDWEGISAPGMRWTALAISSCSTARLCAQNRVGQRYSNGFRAFFCLSA